jgi:hypothetical protein
MPLRPRGDSDLASRYKGLGWRYGAMAALLLGASPLAAQQDNSSTAGTPATSAPAPTGNIGPRELSNFSLEGTVTRRSAEPAATQATPAPTAVRDPQTRDAAGAGSVRSGPARSAGAETRLTRTAQAAAPDPIAQRPTLREPSVTATAAAAAPAFSPQAPLPSTPIEAPSGFSPLPWIAALLLLGAGAVVYFGRQRRRQGYAAHGVSEFFSPEKPLPSPPPDARVPTPAPRKAPAPSPAPETASAPVPRSGVITSRLRAVPEPPPGVVTTSLRPWIELELEPSQAMVTDDHAAIAFDVTLFNSGSAPARDVAVEACLINANQQQDVQLTQFYSAPSEVQDKIPSVAPMSRITLKSAVRLPRAAVQEYEVEGRKLFMPMVAINSRYRWSSGEGQSAASFLVGSAANDHAKLAPLRLDKGRRGWKVLAARRYEKGIRR